jgi:tetratricopeptide (TPR) repeat protein
MRQVEETAVIHDESADMRLFWPIATMTHVDELLQWLVDTITSQPGIRVAQLWKYLPQSTQQSKPELQALALTGISAPTSVLASSPVAALVKLMAGPQNQIASQPVQNLFPDYLAILLRRRGVTYCAGYCARKDLDLPLENSYRSTRSKLMLILFLSESFHGSLLEIYTFLEQALMLAEKHGLLRIHRVVQWNGSMAQLSTSHPLEDLIPRRTANVSGNLLALSDKSARRLYETIDDRSTVRELVNRTHLTAGETVKSLQMLLNQRRIELYEPEEQRELEESPAISSNALDCYNRGDTLFASERYQEALEAYEQTIDLDPNYVAAYNRKGDVLLQLKRGEEAEDAYKQAVLRSVRRIR